MHGTRAEPNIPASKKMLEEFVGMVTSDSWPAWNHVGTEHQKCHLHYKMDINTTMEENKGAEFQAFAKKLIQILWDSHTKEKGHDPDDDLQTKERKRRNLMRRLAYLMNKDYADGDCKRYLKRLRREFYHLFSHVLDWHNNKAERAVRCFVLLRHVMFSNRTELDADTYAKLLSIIGTYTMRGVNPLEYMVEAMSQPYGSPVELPRPPPVEAHLAFVRSALRIRRSCTGHQLILNNVQDQCVFRRDPAGSANADAQNHCISADPFSTRFLVLNRPPLLGHSILPQARLIKISLLRIVLLAGPPPHPRHTGGRHVIQTAVGPRSDHRVVRVARVRPCRAVFDGAAPCIRRQHGSSLPVSYGRHACPTALRYTILNTLACP